MTQDDRKNTMIDRLRTAIENYQTAVEETPGRAQRLIASLVVCPTDDADKARGEINRLLSQFTRQYPADQLPTDISDHPVVRAFMEEHSAGQPRTV